MSPPNRGSRGKPEVDRCCQSPCSICGRSWRERRPPRVARSPRHRTCNLSPCRTGSSRQCHGNCEGESNLLEVVDALGSASGLACRLHRRQQQGNQDRDDRDHDQEFNECKSATHGIISVLCGPSYRRDTRAPVHPRVARTTTHIHHLDLSDPWQSARGASVRNRPATHRRHEQKDRCLSRQRLLDSRTHLEV